MHVISKICVKVWHTFNRLQEERMKPICISPTRHSQNPFYTSVHGNYRGLQLDYKHKCNSEHDRERNQGSRSSQFDLEVVLLCQPGDEEEIVGHISCERRLVSEVYGAECNPARLTTMMVKKGFMQQAVWAALSIIFD